MKTKKPLELDMLTEGSVWQRTSTGRFVTVIGVTNTHVKNPARHPSVVVFFDSMGRVLSENVPDFLNKRTFYNVDPAAETKITDLLQSSDSEEQESMDAFDAIVAKVEEKPKSKDPFGFKLVVEDVASETVSNEALLAEVMEDASVEDDLIIVDDEDASAETSKDSTDLDPKFAEESEPHDPHVVATKVVPDVDFNFEFEQKDLPTAVTNADLQDKLVQYEQDENLYSGVEYTLHKFTFAVSSEEELNAIDQAFNTEQSSNRIVNVISNEALGLNIDWDARVEATRGWHRIFGQTLTLVLGVREVVEQAKILEITPELPEPATT